MTLRKLFKIIVVLLFLFAVVVGLTSINHPIILKWLAGSARYIGRPIEATVYTNGQRNDSIQVFHVEKYLRSSEKANNYLLSLTAYANSGRMRFLNINLAQKWIGIPAGTSATDYDFIAGHLVQSETGGHFSRFQDDMKGFNFDPQLSFTGKQIKFNMPVNELKFDSVRIELK